jgi:hypothetical protein
LLIWTFVVPYDEFCIFEKLYVATFAFCLDSCIVKKGEKFVHALGTWECLEAVPIGSGNF